MQVHSAGKMPVHAISNVIAFVPRPDTAWLSWRDRIEVEQWRERAHEFGYDRLVIHERAAADPPDVESFLSIYRNGARWARWCLARRRGGVLAWCATSGNDVGNFPSVGEALGLLLTTD